MAKFIGQYAADVQRLTVAALISGQHAHLLGAPGSGKTTISLAVLKGIYGNDFGFLRIDPSTRPESVSGAVKLDVLMEQSRIEHNVDESLYAAAYKALLLDEFPRASVVVLNQMIQLLDRKASPAATVPAICTANYLAKDNTVEAVYDRLALWGWVNPTGQDYGAIAEAQLMALGNGGELDAPLPLPSAADIAAVRAMVPTPRSISAIRNVIEQVSAEAVTSGFGVNNRRVAQWSWLLFYTSAFETGSADFGSVPSAALNSMRWAYPLRTAEQAAQWAQLTGSIGDPVGAAIDAVLAGVVDQINTAARLDIGQRAMELGKVVGEAQRTLSAISDDGSGRAAEAVNVVMSWFATAVRGEKIAR